VGRGPTPGRFLKWPQLLRPNLLPFLGVQGLAVDLEGVEQAIQGQVVLGCPVDVSFVSCGYPDSLPDRRKWVLSGERLVLAPVIPDGEEVLCKAHQAGRHLASVEAHVTDREDRCGLVHTGPSSPTKSSNPAARRHSTMSSQRRSASTSVSMSAPRMTSDQHRQQSVN
jgi:hypothetical protein